MLNLMFFTLYAVSLNTCNTGVSRHSCGHRSAWWSIFAGLGILWISEDKFFAASWEVYLSTALHRKILVRILCASMGVCLWSSLRMYLFFVLKQWLVKCIHSLFRFFRKDGRRRVWPYEEFIHSTLRARPVHTVHSRLAWCPSLGLRSLPAGSGREMMEID